MGKRTDTLVADDATAAKKPDTEPADTEQDTAAADAALDEVEGIDKPLQVKFRDVTVTVDRAVFDDARFRIEYKRGRADGIIIEALDAAQQDLFLSQVKRGEKIVDCALELLEGIGEALKATDQGN